MFEDKAAREEEASMSNGTVQGTGGGRLTLSSLGNRNSPPRQMTIAKQRTSAGEEVWHNAPPGLTPWRDNHPAWREGPPAPQTPSPQLSTRPLRNGDRLSSGIKLTFLDEDRQPGARSMANKQSGKGHTRQEVAGGRKLSTGIKLSFPEEESHPGIPTTEPQPGTSNRRSKQNGYSGSQSPETLLSISAYKRVSAAGNVGTADNINRQRNGRARRGKGRKGLNQGHGSPGELGTADDDSRYGHLWRGHGSAGELGAADDDSAYGHPRRVSQLKHRSAGELEGMDGEEAVRSYLQCLELEKEKADELAAQMALQAQVLMEERTRMKADNDDLKRNHDMMAQRLQLLESILQPPNGGVDIDNVSPRQVDNGDGSPTQGGYGDVSPRQGDFGDDSPRHGNCHANGGDGTHRDQIWYPEAQNVWFRA